MISKERWDKYDISEEDSVKIEKRDLEKRGNRCVYCRKPMQEYPHQRGCPGNKATIEHMDLVKPQTDKNVAVCCGSCNASRKQEHLKWFESAYCKKNDINLGKVSKFVRAFLKNKSK